MNASIIITSEGTLALALGRPPPAQNVLLCRSVMPVGPFTTDETWLLPHPGTGRSLALAAKAKIRSVEGQTVTFHSPSEKNVPSPADLLQREPFWAPDPTITHTTPPQ